MAHHSNDLLQRQPRLVVLAKCNSNTDSNTDISRGYDSCSIKTSEIGTSCAWICMVVHHVATIKFATCPVQPRPGTWLLICIDQYNAEPVCLLPQVMCSTFSGRSSSTGVNDTDLTRNLNAELYIQMCDRTCQYYDCDKCTQFSATGADNTQVEDVQQLMPACSSLSRPLRLILHTLTVP